MNLNSDIVVALIAAVVSIGTAIWTYFTSKRSERSIELLKANLSELQAENNARRDYEYEARKRLYQEYEPLLFQLVELSENALHRIRSLARTARNA